MTEKRFCDLFFTRDDDNLCVWLCSCGKKRGENGTGYSNLTSHIRDFHIKKLESVLESAVQPRADPRPVGVALGKKNTVKIHGRMKYIIENISLFEF